MPYISDQVIEKEMDFIEQLIDIHGNINSTFINSNLSDDKKIKLLRDCLTLAQKEDPNITEPTEEMFKALSILCCSQITQLQTLWLTEKQKSNPNVTPSIDQPDVEWSEEQGAALLDSLNGILCPRCYK